jgi:hypothetical protein
VARKKPIPLPAREMQNQKVVLHRRVRGGLVRSGSSMNSLHLEVSQGQGGAAPRTKSSSSSGSHKKKRIRSPTLSTEFGKLEVRCSVCRSGRAATRAHHPARDAHCNCCCSNHARHVAMRVAPCDHSPLRYHFPFFSCLTHTLSVIAQRSSSLIVLLISPRSDDDRSSQNI